MKKLFLAIIPLLMAACDDGDIEEKYSYQQEGLKVAVDLTISGTDTWPEGYSVALSGFENQRNDKEIAEYSEISKNINGSQNQLHVTLGGIPQNVNYLEITVLNRIRQRVITLWQTELSSSDKNSKDTLYYEIGEIKAGMFQYIQDEYFTKSCANCHGLGQSAAAGLYLTEGKSYVALVNVMSQKRNSINVVTPNDTAQSSLHKILVGDFPEVTHNHKDKLATDKDKELIDLWILNGAKE